MSLTEELLDIYRGVLTQPSEFFESEDRRDGFGFSLKFAAVNLIISGIVSAVSVAALGSASAALGEALGAGSVFIIAGVMLVATPIFGLIGLLISSGLVHIFVSLLGGENGYSETLSVMGYATAVQPITAVFSLIPLLGGIINFFIGIYAIFIQVKGIENFQGLSTGRALAAILLPVLLIIALVVVIAAVFMASALAGVAAA